MMNSPKEIAGVSINVGKAKTQMSVSKMFLLAFFAGMFIAIGSVAATTISSTIANPSLAKAAGAFIFPVGLAMVLIAGSELFTGNALIIVGVLSKEVKVVNMLKNWITVYIGNFLGSIFIALLISLSGNLDLFGGAVATSAIATANAKCGLDFLTAMSSGILCNILVCIAVWMSFGAKTVSGKIIAIFFPIFAFVLGGFEHSVANMYFITAGLFAKNNPAYLELAINAGKSAENLNIGNFLIGNLLPVTIGNIIGGCLVGALYYLIFVREDKKT